MLSLPQCTPLPGAILDIWHCAADGRYSGYAAAGGEADGIFQQTSGRTILSLSPAGSGFTARLVLAVVPGAPNLDQDQTAQPTGPGAPPAV